ncbi:hypothetical protein RRG08_067336 [Elysia crispata]|uniref:Uncharacterized protein n=1 Tax=Elysia crispata TaxID=231223 RepID=A0AAE0Z7L8_9GAST|nr:hypothetical protein RRG08_067336 [Elysia crispata]
MTGRRMTSIRVYYLLFLMLLKISSINMDDPSPHHLDLQIDVPFDNYDSDVEPLAVVQRRLLNSMEESSRNAAITAGKIEAYDFTCN